LPIVANVFAQALRAAYARHSMLGARYACVNGDWLLLLDSPPEVLTDVCEPGLTEDQWIAKIIEVASAMATRPHFPKMHSVALLRRNATEGALVIAVNHVTADMVGMNVLCADLLKAYECLVNGSGASLQPGLRRIAACANDERCLIESDCGQRSLQWWRQFLDGYRPARSLREMNGRPIWVECTLSPEALARIRKRATVGRVSTGLLFLARYFEALGDAAVADEDLLIAAVQARRGEVAGDDVVVGSLMDFLLYRLRGRAWNDTDALARQLLLQHARNMRFWLPYSFLVKKIAPDLYQTTCGICENEYNYVHYSMAMDDPAEFVCEVRIPVAWDWIAFRRCVAVVERADSCMVWIAVDSNFVSKSELRMLLSRMTDW
jgi:hypothetical protein